MKHGPQKRTTRKIAYFQYFNLKRTRRRDRALNEAFMLQLGTCKSDEARRLLLGVSEQFTEAERAA